MAELSRSHARSVETALVTVPADVLSMFGRPPAGVLPPRTLLVPGTIAPYKRPAAALDWAARERDRFDRVLYAGSDDGSGTWRWLKAEALQRGILVEQRVLDREQMVDALSTAEAVAVLSGLESLGFSVVEALLLNPTVVASPIAAHREMAERLGREPTWSDGNGVPPTEVTGSPLNLRTRNDQRTLGR